LPVCNHIFIAIARAEIVEFDAGLRRRGSQRRRFCPATTCTNVPTAD
jgi:hypothetical protein